MSSLLSLYELARDFHQLVGISARSLSFRLHNPMDFGMVTLTDFISADFSFLTLLDSTIIIYMFVALLFCTLFSICMLKNERHLNTQTNDDQSYQKPTKASKFIYQSSIIIITTLIPPVLQISINIFKGSSSNPGIWGVAIVSLLIGLIADPILFAKSIGESKKKLNEFDAKGSRITDKTKVHLEQLRNNHSILKNLYSSYSENWHYFKFFSLLLKIFRIIRYAIISDPNTNLTAYLIFTILDLVLNIIFAIGSIKKQPYLHRRENTCLCLSFVAQAICLVLQMILWLSCYDNENGQIVISILQLITCLLVYHVYWAISTIASFKKVTSIYKIIRKQLEFTPAADSHKQLCSFKNSLILSEQYNKNSECMHRIWMPFWENILTKSVEFKGPTDVKGMHFISVGGAPPDLMDFQGTVGERFEENTRIMKAIGKDAYRGAIRKQKAQNVQRIMQMVLEHVPPIDAQYKGQMYKASFYPFPFTVQLQPDKGNQYLNLTNPVELEELANENSGDASDREVRQILRCLNFEVVNHKFTKKTTRQKKRKSKDSEIEETYTVDATIKYYSGELEVVLAENYMTTYKNWDSTQLQLGKGFSVKLTYYQGEGKDSEGDYFNGGLHILHQDYLTNGEGFSRTGSSPIASIIQNHKALWVSKLRKLKERIELHKQQKREMFLFKKNVLSYEFHSYIFAGDINTIQERQQVVDFLQTEENPKLATINLDDLYIKMDMVRFGQFEPLLFFFFDDLWKLNSDIPLIKKNAQILNPESSECIIYQRNSNIDAWKAVLLNKKLRTRNGKGFFNDKLLYELQRKLKKCTDKRNNFITEESLL